MALSVGHGVIQDKLKRTRKTNKNEPDSVLPEELQGVDSGRGCSSFQRLTIWIFDIDVDEASHVLGPCHAKSQQNAEKASARASARAQKG